MTETHETLLQMYEDAKILHTETLDRLAKIEIACRAMSQTLIVDSIYALKQTIQYLEDTRLQADKIVTALSRLGCVIAIKHNNHLVGDWATATAQVTEQPGVPHPDNDTEAYTAMMRALGAGEDLIAAKTVHPRFTAIAEIMNKLAAEGKPIPDALKTARSVPKYTVTARARKRGGLDAIAHDSAQ